MLMSPHRFASGFTFTNFDDFERDDGYLGDHWTVYNGGEMEIVSGYAAVTKYNNGGTTLVQRSGWVNNRGYTAGRVRATAKNIASCTSNQRLNLMCHVDTEANVKCFALFINKDGFYVRDNGNTLRASTTYAIANDDEIIFEMTSTTAFRVLVNGIQRASGTGTATSHGGRKYGFGYEWNPGSSAPANLPGWDNVYLEESGVDY